MRKQSVKGIVQKQGKILLYAIVAAAAVLALYMLDTRWSLHMDTKSVVVAKVQILPHQEIQEGDVEIKKLKIDYVIPGAMGDPDQIIGKEALQLIEAGDQFTSNRIDKTAMLRQPGASIYEVPDEWLLSVPGSLRRLDRIKIKAVKVTKGAQIQADTGEVVPEDNSYNNTILLENVVVAYYKDNNSNEVLNASSNDNPNLREFSTTRGRKLELELTDEQLNLLADVYHKNYQFIVGYQP